MRNLNEITSVLSEEQRQLLADIIVYGGWGGCDMEFKENGKWVTAYCYGYITNEAYKGGHFARNGINNRCKTLYKSLGLEGNKEGKACAEFSWAHDWWEDGRGSVLFIREELVDEFEQWAKEYNNK